MESLQDAPAFELSGPALRIFQRAVACLAKMGRDAAVILRADELVLHGADDSHSAAMQFAFRKRFFRTTPASVSLPGSAPMREANVVVGARQLLVALKGAQQRTGQAESLSVGLSRPVAAGRRSHAGDQQQRLVLEFTARFGGKVRHRVPLLESMPFLPGEPNAGPHSAALSPSLLARVLDHCAPMARGSGSCEEVTLSAVRGEGLRVQSHDLMNGGGSAGQAHRTEVLIQRSDLEASSLDGKGGEVIFSGRGLRDFARSADACARDLEVLGLADGSALLELRFGAEGGSVACRMAAVADGVVRTLQDFSAVLIIATRSFGDEAGTEGGSTAPATLQGTVQATPGGRRPQPRQGSTKKRAVALPPAAPAEIFDAFPDHSGQIPRTQASTAPTQARQPWQAPAAWSTGAETQPTQPAQPAAMPPPQQLPPQQPPQLLPQHAPQRQAPPVVARPPPDAVLGAPTQPAWGAAPRAAAPALAVTPQVDSLPPTAPAPMPPMHMAATQPGEVFQAPPPAPAPAAVGSAWWQGGQAPPAEVLAGRVAAAPMLASQLAKALQVPDNSDDELIGADPDEVAFARGVQEESVDWFDVERLW
uniref:Checkpoint protein n=1 Tax=Alexandrium monilatum TaxID=311494 RepID=A0A7S4R0J2_9DINO